MLDLKYVISNADAVKQNCRDRNVSPDILADVDHLVALEAERKVQLQAVEGIRREQNEVAQATGKEKDPARRAELVARGKGLKQGLADQEAALNASESRMKQYLARIPNLSHPDAPVGQTD